MPRVCGALETTGGTLLNWTKDAALSDIKVPVLLVADPVVKNAVEGRWLP